MTGCRVAAEELAYDRECEKNLERYYAFRDSDKFDSAVSDKLELLVADDVLTKEILCEFVEDHYEEFTGAIGNDIGDDIKKQNVGTVIVDYLYLRLRLIAAEYVNVNWEKFA